MHLYELGKKEFCTGLRSVKKLIRLRQEYCKTDMWASKTEMENFGS